VNRTRFKISFLCATSGIYCETMVELIYFNSEREKKKTTKQNVMLPLGELPHAVQYPTQSESVGTSVFA